MIFLSEDRKLIEEVVQRKLLVQVAFLFSTTPIFLDECTVCTSLLSIRVPSHCNARALFN